MSLLNILHHLPPYTTSSYPSLPSTFAPYPPLTSFPFFKEEVVVGGEFRKGSNITKVYISFFLREVLEYLRGQFSSIEDLGFL